MPWAWVVVAGGLSLPARAATFTADFSTPAQWDTAETSTALWDVVNQRISAAISANNVEIDFGTGADGAFNDGPVQTGISVAGATITIDTNVKSTFNFSSFNLSNAAVILATGAQPLRIRVLGPATIEGTIAIPGFAGTNNSAAGPAAGGNPGPGGGAGGSAGTPAPVAGSNGAPAAGPARGGTAGANSGVTDNGGGGGCNGADGANDATAGSGGAAGACASTRATIAGQFETTFVGGGGGGGGAAFTGAGSVSGAGGGGGAGALHFAALTLSFGAAPGAINAIGGDGGNNPFDVNGADCGGAGGGGSGGSVWLQTASSLTSAGNPGNADISRGNAGTDGGSVNCGGLGDGGNGSIGIVRVDASAYVGPATTATNVSAIRNGQSYSITSKAIDTTFSDSVFDAPTETVGCGANGTLAVSYSGSSDGATFGAAVPAAQIATLNGSRYIRYTVTISTTGANPPCLTGLSIPYSSVTGGADETPLSTDFKLKGGLACATLASGEARSTKKSPLETLSDFALIGAAAYAAWAPLRRRRRGQRSASLASAGAASSQPQYPTT
jgi:hypothetical protein